MSQWTVDEVLVVVEGFDVGGTNVRMPCASFRMDMIWVSKQYCKERVWGV